MQSSSARSVTAPLAVVVATFILLLVFRVAQQTPDSLGYALSVKTGQNLFHPHHLLFNAVVHGTYLAISPLCQSCDAILAGQLHNILWACVSLACCYYVAGVLYGSRFAGLVTAALLLATRGFWLQSTSVDVYVPVTGCVSAIVALLVVNRGRHLGAKARILISLFMAMAVFYHQSSVLFCVPLTYYMLATRGRRGLRPLAQILSLAGLIVVAAYILVFIFNQKGTSTGGFFRFILAYGMSPHPDWGTFGHFSVTGLGQLVHSQLRNLVAWPWRIRHGVILLTVVLSSMFIWHGLQAIKGQSASRERAFLLVWVATYYLLFLWWLPKYDTMFVSILWPQVLLAALAAKDIVRAFAGTAPGKRLVVACLVGLVLVLAAANFTTTFLPQHKSRGQDYWEASRLAEVTSEDWVVLSDYGVCQNLRYYYGREKVGQAGGALLRFYVGEPLPDNFDVTDTESILVPLSCIAPEFKVAGHFTGYTSPRQWLRYVEWLFDFEYDDENTVVACRQFGLVEGAIGCDYVLLSPDKTAVEGVGEVFETLDALTAASSGVGSTPFRTWLAKASP